MRTKHKTAVDAFWAHVVKGANDECWLWGGSVCGAGYGQFNHAGAHYFTHRFAYAEFVGPIVHRDVCHRCDVRHCVNPAHLFNASHSVNMKDAFEKGRIKLSTQVLRNIELGRAKREAKARRRAEYLERVSLGLEKARDELGRFNDGRVLGERLRDANGHFASLNTLAAPTVPRQRNSKGHFI